MTGGDTGEGDEGDVEFRNARIPDQVRQFLGMDYASGVERLNNYSPAVHSTAETMTPYLPSTGRLVAGFRRAKCDQSR
jgi:hypothetical protein